MSTIEQVKLSNAGDELVLVIEKAEQVPVGRYPEYAFIGTTQGAGTDAVDVDLRVPKASADRQLTRLNLALADTVGMTLRFSRGENKSDASKPYWNIDVVSGAKGGTGRPATAGAAAVGQTPARETGAAATPQPAPAEKSSAIYKRMTQYVLSDIMPLYEANNVPFDGATVAAIVATLFINTKNGH